MDTHKPRAWCTNKNLEEKQGPVSWPINTRWEILPNTGSSTEIEPTVRLETTAWSSNLPRTRKAITESRFLRHSSTRSTGTPAILPCKHLQWITHREMAKATGYPSAATSRLPGSSYLPQTSKVSATSGTMLSGLVLLQHHLLPLSVALKLALTVRAEATGWKLSITMSQLEVCSFPMVELLGMDKTSSWIRINSLPIQASTPRLLSTILQSQQSTRSTLLQEKSLVPKPFLPPWSHFQLSWFHTSEQINSVNRFCII